MMFGLGSTLVGGDLYLPKFGPPPLRFMAQSSKAKAFVWPVPLKQCHSLTNQTNQTNQNVTASSTNAPLVLDPTIQTNIVTETRSESGFASLLPMAVPTESPEPNPLAASNLLIITPQMLADYFKANVEGTATNGFGPGGIEVPFNPPILRIPESSKATYRVQ